MKNEESDSSGVVKTEDVVWAGAGVAAGAACTDGACMDVACTDGDWLGDGEAGGVGAGGVAADPILSGGGVGGGSRMTLHPTSAIATAISARSAAPLANRIAALR